MHSLALVLCFFCLSQALLCYATTYTVIVGPGYTFSPSSLQIEIGDSVVFNKSSTYYLPSSPLPLSNALLPRLKTSGSTTSMKPHPTISTALSIARQQEPPPAQAHAVRPALPGCRYQSASLKFNFVFTYIYFHPIIDYWLYRKCLLRLPMRRTLFTGYRRKNEISHSALLNLSLHI